MGSSGNDWGTYKSILPCRFYMSSYALLFRSILFHVLWSVRSALLAALFLFPVSSFAQFFGLMFPIQSESAYSAPISTVLDHSTPFFYANAEQGSGMNVNHKSVEAYTGEIGNDGCGHSGEPCGYYNSNNKIFAVNGNYVGYGGDDNASALDGLQAQYYVLNYRGHSGYDFPAIKDTAVVVAAASGDLYVPAQDPINNPGMSYDPWCDFHTLYIDHGNGYITVYLHVDHIVINGQQKDYAATSTSSAYPHQCKSATSTYAAKTQTSDQFIAHVTKGEQIAVVGSWDNSGIIGPHLHFEVRHCDTIGKGLMGGCRIIDPYGWEGGKTWSDPLNEEKVKYCQKEVCPSNPFAGQPAGEHRDAPLWDDGADRPVITGTTLSPSSDGYQVTITGNNFTCAAPASNIHASIWSSNGYYWQPPDEYPSSIQPSTATQMIVDLPTTDFPDPTAPDKYLVKVGCKDGPRSEAVALDDGVTPAVPDSTITSTPTAEAIYGEAAPGGGTINSYGGIHSANQLGDLTLNVGIDTNGDGAPDRFADLEMVSGKLSAISPNGDANSTDTIENAKLNNEGDLTFLDASMSPSAMYLLPAGSATATKIIEDGAACLSPCPINSSNVTVNNISGPFGISDSGNVVFGLTLYDWNSATATSYMYMYSPSDRTFKKIAYGGESAPGGGTFDGRSFSGNNANFTSDGDIVFIAYNNASSPGSGDDGIYRYSYSGGLSKVVAVGDPAPDGGTYNYIIEGANAVSGRSVTFSAEVSGGAASDIIAFKKDVTQPSLSDVTVIAYQGEPTGTAAGGTFCQPETGAGPNFDYDVPPSTRPDGAVLFFSYLCNATASNGSSTNSGLFLWDGKKINKVAVNGDTDSSGKVQTGIYFSLLNDSGGVYYYVLSRN